MKKAILLTSAICALILLTLAAPATATFEAASCGEVAAWVAEHQDQLPRTLAEFESVPDGYEPGVFKALQADLRDELWNQFITEYVTAQPSLDEAGVDEILGFRGYFRSPEEFQGIDEAANQVIGNLLSSFTLHLVTPIADLVVDSEALGQMAIKHCDCSRTYDPGCGSYLCLFHEVGCGPQNGESCTGRYNP